VSRDAQAPSMALRCCAINIDEWAPDDAEWRHALALVQPADRQRVASLRSHLVAKRTLVGRLLARLMIQQDLGIANQRINLGRTPEGKPFLKNLCCPSGGVCSGGAGASGGSIGGDDESPSASRNWSAIQYAFNLSHHGAWVVVASLRPCSDSDAAPHAPRATLLVGVDVVKYEFRRGFASVEDFFASLADGFTEAEWEHIRGGSTAAAAPAAAAAAAAAVAAAVPAAPAAGTPNAQCPLRAVKPGLPSWENPRTISVPGDAPLAMDTASSDNFRRLQRLYRRWAVKEAYTKALGVGLGFGFGRVECLADTAESPTPKIVVDGEQLGSEWAFFTASLDRLHHVVVCAAGARVGGAAAHLANDAAEEATSWGCPYMKVQLVSYRQLLSELQPCGERSCPTTPLESLC
jgi:phosphopantetheinyl transferase